MRTAQADGPGGPQHREFRDGRYHHDHFYPVRGEVFPVLPHDYRIVAHGDSRYYFHDGIWYRPIGPRFVVVAPPLGLIVPFLPLYYTTVWVGGIPYYYANEVYYVQRGNGYAVATPPKGETTQTSTTEQVFIYPRLGQSEKQQADDRYECHRWSVNQTGFDPTQPSGVIPENQRTGKQAEYQRALSACLDGRGYTTK